MLSSSEVLSSRKLVQLVDDLKSRYPSRITLFDLPPLTAADDVIAFSPHVDAVLLVTQEGKTRRENVTRAIEVLDPTPVIGTVLNRASKSTTAPY